MHARRSTAVGAVLLSLTLLCGTAHAAPGDSVGDTVGGTQQGVQAAAAEVSRLAGSTRYETAVAISSSWAPRSAPIVLVASGADFPDALAAAGLARILGSPILLTRADRLPSVTADELRRLQPDQVYVLGGEAAVSDAVLDELQQVTAAPDDPGTVTRVGGADRYASAAAIATKKPGTGMPVFIARGDAYPDALSVSSAVGQRNGALLLVRPTSIPRATRDALTRLQPSHIIVVGGEASVSAEVYAELEAWKNPEGYADPVVSRVGGADRWETSAAVATYLSAPGDVYLATGLGFPDALAVGPRAARSDLGAAAGSVLLTRPDRLPAPIDYHLWTRSRLPYNHPGQVIAVGGPAVVSDAVVERAASYFQ